MTFKGQFESGVSLRKPGNGNARHDLQRAHCNAGTRECRHPFFEIASGGHDELCSSAASILLPRRRHGQWPIRNK
jgi:hypothetical protein